MQNLQKQLETSKATAAVLNIYDGFVRRADIELNSNNDCFEPGADVLWLRHVRRASVA